MKPVYARWIISLYDEFRSYNELITEIFQMTSFTEALTNESTEDENAFAFLKTLLLKI